MYTMINKGMDMTRKDFMKLTKIIRAVQGSPIKQELRNAWWAKVKEPKPCKACGK